MDFEESRCFFPSISVNIHHPDHSDHELVRFRQAALGSGSAVFFLGGKCDMFYMCDHHVTLQIEILNRIQKCFERLTS